jgi:hypothetical protein
MILIMMENRLFVEGQHLIFRRRVLLPPPLIFLLLLLGAYYDHGASAFTPSFVATTPVRGWTTTATTPFTTTTLTPTTPTSLQMVSYEDLMEKLPSKAVIDAVESSSSGGSRVVASDVATKAGVSLSQARKDLTALASISRGDIAVDKTDGELIYSFPNNLSGVLAQNSRKYQALQTFRQVWPTLFWGVRVTFGIALLASLVAIFSTIFFINSSSNRDDRDDRGSNGGGGGLRMGSSWGGFWGPSPFDFFFYRPYGYYGYYGSPSSTSNNRDPEEMSFLESIFSFVFGDGNPNASLEERRLSLAASMIRQNNGAVTAEQLAPFCDDVPNPDKVLNSDSVYVDEVRCSFVCFPLFCVYGVWLRAVWILVHSLVVLIYFEACLSVFSYTHSHSITWLPVVVVVVLVGCYFLSLLGLCAAHCHGTGWRTTSHTEWGDCVHVSQLANVRRRGRLR